MPNGWQPQENFQTLPPPCKALTEVRAELSTIERKLRSRLSHADTTDALRNAFSPRRSVSVAGVTKIMVSSICDYPDWHASATSLRRDTINLCWLKADRTTRARMIRREPMRGFGLCCCFPTQVQCALRNCQPSPGEESGRTSGKRTLVQSWVHLDIGRPSAEKVRASSPGNCSGRANSLCVVI